MSAANAEFLQFRLPPACAPPNAAYQLSDVAALGHRSRQVSSCSHRYKMMSVYQIADLPPDFRAATRASISSYPARSDPRCDRTHLHQVCSFPQNSKPCSTTTSCDNSLRTARQTKLLQHVAWLSSGRVCGSLAASVHQNAHQHV